MEKQSSCCRYPFFIAKSLALIDQERIHVMLNHENKKPMHLQNPETEIVESERFNCLDSFLSVTNEQDQESKPNNQLHAS
jgi:hypothetical protein